MRNGGQIIVESLIGLGVNKAFGVPGESYLAVLDALYDHQEDFEFVLCRQEGGAAFMAAAYGKLTGKPGICMVTRGPGVTNASIGIHTAMQDSAPMIVFVGQVGTDLKGREAFQEIDYKAVFGSMAKWVVEIDDVSRIPEMLARAWRTAISGRPGPVVIALPEDMLTSQSNVLPLTSLVKTKEASPSIESLKELSEILRKSERPLILMGGCNWSKDGQVALQAFAETSNIPVVAAFRYQDQFDNFSPVYSGEAGVGMPPHVKQLIKDADTILAINVRFGEMTTDAYTLLNVPVPQQTLIHVHASDLELGKIYQPSLAIQAGPNEIAQSLQPVSGDWTEWTTRARVAFVANIDAPKQPSPVDMVEVMKFLRDRLPKDVILTNGAGNFTVWPNKFFTFGKDARLLAPQSGAMGYGVPAAIAAKSVSPEKTVVCFAGDGDFQMTCNELATSVQAEAQPIILVLNNGIYGTIRAHQERQYPARVSATTMVSPDFVALAKAYGFHAEKVNETSEFKDAFERALASDSGALLELNISEEAITPRATLTDIRNAALKKD